MAIVCKKVVKVNVFPFVVAVFLVNQPQSRHFIVKLAHVPRPSAHPLSAALCHVVPDNCAVNKKFHSLSIRTATTSDEKAYDCSINHELRGGQWARGSVSFEQLQLHLRVSICFHRFRSNNLLGGLTSYVVLLWLDCHRRLAGWWKHRRSWSSSQGTCYLLQRWILETHNLQFLTSWYVTRFERKQMLSVSGWLTNWLSVCVFLSVSVCARTLCVFVCLCVCLSVCFVCVCMCLCVCGVCMFSLFVCVCNKTKFKLNDSPDLQP